MASSSFSNDLVGLLSGTHLGADLHHSLAGLLKTHPQDLSGLTSPQFILHSTAKAVSLESKLGSERLPSVFQVQSASEQGRPSPFRRVGPCRLVQLTAYGSALLAPVTLTAWSPLNGDTLFLHLCACYSLHPERPSNACLPFKFQLVTNTVSPQEAFHNYSPHHHHPILTPAAQQPIYT